MESLSQSFLDIADALVLKLAAVSMYLSPVIPKVIVEETLSYQADSWAGRICGLWVDSHHRHVQFIFNSNIFFLQCMTLHVLLT